jgi:hypothetical protein
VTNALAYTNVALNITVNNFIVALAALKTTVNSCIVVLEDQFIGRKVLYS